jgi:nitrite reductase/ring-hydroxylating ferredoxin subunit
MAKYVVATTDELRPGQRKVVEVAGRSIGLFNVNGEFFALRNRCPHQGGPLCSGRLHGFVESSLPGEYEFSRPGELLRCPWHGWEFDIRTGQSWFDPAKTRVRAYEVSVAPGGALAADAPPTEGGLAKGPYVAETYPVSIDREYVLIEVDA